MRRARTAAVLAGLLLGTATAQLLDTQTGDEAFQFAQAFERIPDENGTELLDDVVVPAVLESEKAVAPPVETEPRDLRPLDVSTTERHAGDLPVSLPYGGALVAVEATALLVGGAALVVLVVAKVKSRSMVVQYDYDDGYTDPMLQSLLYSDMDYAAI
ncbi:hypothetical protein PHYPSEUDO_001371 [Phytophthora pseudosyringae]|uniref:RxLR effector protein n=1 Tax=Phytophthora pseudosyringae TaxID=221518 RepID=A0A8T1WEV3_9STRA|nr:hypothetical protein PHYPSEUDO_001371 [Phytophthora pseudosyringae]